MMRAGPRTLTVVAQVALLLMAISTVELLAQAVTVHRAGDALAVRAPTFTFIKGEPLVRLKDGRACARTSSCRSCPARAAPQWPRRGRCSS